ncbi:Uncharacterized membrane protein YesL [Ruminococcaceae bacterium YAD3003]|nr:Uncharacterized membrane protein YesL [Ruminococcaceae bacterium YAD3003]
MSTNKGPATRPSFFNPKSAGTRFLTSLANLIIVNFLFLITCIPVITIGASVTSLYRITIAILAGDYPSVWRDYLSTFKNNFLKATLLQLLYMGLAAFFLFEIYMVNNMMDEQYYWAQYPAYFFLFAIFASSIYAFPLLAWFEESFKQILKNSVLIAVSNLPVTIMVTALTAGLAWLAYQFTVTTMSLMIFMGFSSIAFFYSIFYKRIFEKLGAKISFDEKEGKD